MLTAIRRIAMACCAFILALALWNLAVTRWREMQTPVPGAFYNIDQHQMHLYCTGLGTPTVLIEAGYGSDWLDWQTIQPGLSRRTKVCTYDRAGLGWSEPRPRPRDAEAIAKQLHALLDQAGIERPLVLTGHSAGGLYIREYAREFPAEIAAGVFVDAVSTDQMNEHPGVRAAYEADKRSAARNLWKHRLRIWSGVDRLLGRCHQTPGKGLDRFAELYNVKTCRLEYVDGELGEYLDFETSIHQALRLTTFGNKPVLVLSRDPDSPSWEREQEALKSLSPQSWRVIARHAGHKIHQDRPELVITEMSRLIEYLRGGPPPPFGTTKTQ
jgi:pimeloyl-ACP methyl ester carboxylesterase